MFRGRSVAAFNDQIGLIAPCKTSEAFAIHGPTLLGLLSNSQGEDVEFTLEEHDCIIKTGRSTFKLPWFPETDFLIEEPEDKWHSKMALTDEALKGISYCLPTASREDTQRALNGVCFNGVTHTLYSCDGDVLTRYTLNKNMKAASVSLLPIAYCESLLKVAEAVGENTAFELDVNHDWAKAEIGTYVVYGRLTENKTPFDFANLVTKTLQSKPHYVAVPEGLNEALTRARVIADPETAKTALAIEKGRLRLLTQTHHGIVRDSVPMPDHPDVEASVSSALVQRAIGLCNEMAIMDNATAYQNGILFQLVSNMDK